jgi:hypothetical protein
MLTQIKNITHVKKKNITHICLNAQRVIPTTDPNIVSITNVGIFVLRS